MNKIIFRNVKIKIIAILFAIFIWFFVETENNYKYSFNIPIRISNLAQSKIITNAIPSHAKIIFWGKGRELLALLLNQKLHYNIDLTNITESELFVLDKKNIRLPRAANIEILNIVEPDSVYVNIVNLEEKEVPISPNIKIDLVQGYTIVNGIQLKPDSALIIGSKTGLDSISFIKTEELIYKNVKRDLNKKAKLISPTVKNVWLKQHELSFFVDIQKLLEKPLVEIPVYVINKPRRLELTVIPSSLSLTLIGGADLLLPITNKDITAYIDYNKVHGSKEKDHLAYIDKPDGISYKDIKPKRFKIVVTKIR